MAPSKLHQTPPPLLSLIALFLILATKVHSQGQTTEFYIDSFDPNSNELSYQGAAYVPQQKRFLRLTSAETYQYGRVLYSRPLRFYDKEAGLEANFEVTLKFRITAANNDPADGLAFFIAPACAALPTDSVGGSLGIFDSSGNGSSIFAVEFDTYVNPEWDPNFRHIGIDLNSRKSVIAVKINDELIGEEVVMLIVYVPQTKTITISAGNNTHPYRYNIIDRYDLRNLLPEMVQVGVSAATGKQYATHDLHSWYFYSTLESVDKYNRENREPYIKQYVI